MAFVLVVDDHVDTCRVLARIMRCVGAAAKCVHSGAEALVLMASSCPPALVLLDVTMPEMDGLETLERIRKMPAAADIPVVMYTAVADANMRRRALELGATEYWIKSDFSAEEFFQRLGRFVPIRV
jgi:CheY-like chemotaxis protein